MTGLKDMSEVERERELEEQRRLKKEEFLSKFAIVFGKILSKGLQEEIQKVLSKGNSI